MCHHYSRPERGGGENPGGLYTESAENACVRIMNAAPQITIM